MAVASGPAGPLAGPVFTVKFGTAHAQIMNNDNTFGAALTTCHRPRVYATRIELRLVLDLATATATGSITDSTAQDDISEKAHQQLN